MSQIPPHARIRLLTLFAAATATAAGILTGWGHPSPYALPGLWAAVVATELAAVHLTFGKQRWTFSLTEAAIAASFTLSAGAWTGLAVSGAVLVVAYLRRQPLMTIAFTVAQYGAATGLGAEFAQAVGGGVWGAVGGMCVFWFARNGLAVAAEILQTNQPFVPLVWESVPLAALHSVGSAGLGILGAWLARDEPVGLVALVVPLVLLWISYDEQATRAAETALFAELARLQERSSDLSLDVSAYVVLTAACRTFDSPDVEMILLAQEGPIHYSGDAIGIHRRRVEPDALDQEWVLNALAECSTVTGIEADRPWCATVLGDVDSPLAVLVARRAVGKPAFGRRDLLLARVLADQAEGWLSSAARSVPKEDPASSRSAREIAPMGADSDQALRVLRDSANRLARLASTTDPAEVGDIVEELHSAERAVASLLGAMALSAEPAFAAEVTAGSDQRGGTSRHDDWTTTGVLTA